MFRFELYFSIFLMLIVFFIGFFLVETSNRGIFFGVRIPIGFEKNENLKKIKREYRKSYTISSLFFWTIYFLIVNIFKEQFPLIMILSLFLFLIILNVNYYTSHKKVKALKKAENWKLDNSRLVVVDTSFRDKDKNNKRAVISPWWFLLPVGVIFFNFVFVVAFYKGMLVNLIGADPAYSTLSFSSFTAMFIIQCALTALFFLIYKMVEKSKQQLNGGDVNVIKHQSRNFRYVASVLFMFMSLMFNINYLLTSMSSLGIMKLSEKASIFMILCLMFLPMIAFIIIFGLVGQGGRYIKYTAETQDSKLIVDRDDDDNYILGSLYYNKYDPSLMVEKRVGIGWDFNYARPAAKIIMGFIATLLIFVLVMLSQLPKMTRERNIEVSKQEISISGTWGITIKSYDIQKVSLESVLPDVVMRTNGAAIGNKMFGRYNLKDYTNSTLFIIDKNKPLVKIELKDNKLVLINYEDVGSTEQLYRKIVETVELKQ